MNTKKTLAAISVTALMFAFAGCQAPEQQLKEDTTGTEVQPDQQVSLTINQPATGGDNGALSAQTGTTEQSDQSSKQLQPVLQFPNMASQEGIKAPVLKSLTELKKTSMTEDNTTQQIIENGLKAQGQNNL